MADLWLHPGFPKAASTTLQRRLFGANPEVRMISPHDKLTSSEPNGSSGSARIRHLVRGQASDRLSSCDSALCQDLPDRVSDPLLQLKEEHRGSLASFVDADSANVFSDETLLMPFRCEVAPANIPERTRFLFDSPGLQPRVIVVVRNQVDLMYSFYAQKFPKLRNTDCGRSIEDYYFSPGGGLRADETVETFDFDHTVTAWENVFGRDRVSVLIFEELLSDPVAFSERLAAILGVDPDFVIAALSPHNAERVRSKSRGSYEVLWHEPMPKAARVAKSLARRLLPSAAFERVRSRIHRLRQKRAAVPGFDLQQKEMIRSRFHDSNLCFAGRHDISHAVLARYGYVLS